jgi:hypothetical protein
VLAMVAVAQLEFVLMNGIGAGEASRERPEI